LRPYRGFSNIAQNTTEFQDTYHSIQSNFTRRFHNGFSVGVNYTLSLSFTGNTGLQERLQHNADGSVSVRSDQAAYEALNKELNLQRHLVKLNWVWDLPDYKTSNAAGRVLGYVINDWQLSGIFTGGSGNRYDLGYSYNTGGSNQNLTGSPDYGARLILIGNSSSGCSSRYSQFNTTAIAGPTYNSVGLESGRNYLVGCPDHTTDLAIARNIRVGGGRLVQLRLDAYNVFDTAIITDRNRSVNFNSPTDQTIRNSQYCFSGSSASCAGLADGTLDPNRLVPRNAGFGAANNWSTNGINGNYGRFIQATIRFQF
jgi:hypothetical protein